MLSNRQRLVVLALDRYQGHLVTAADVADRVQRDFDTACTVAQARSSLDALSARIDNPSPGHQANRAALVAVGQVDGGERLYGLTPAGKLVAKRG